MKSLNLTNLVFLEDMNECNFSFLKEKAKKIFIYLKDLETGIEMKFEECLRKKKIFNFQIQAKIMMMIE